MWKLVAILVLTAASFGLGFYFGQRPVGTLQQTVSDLQHSLKDTSRNISTPRWESKETCAGDRDCSNKVTSVAGEI